MTTGRSLAAMLAVAAGVGLAGPMLAAAPAPVQDVIIQKAEVRVFIKAEVPKDDPPPPEEAPPATVEKAEAKAEPAEPGVRMDLGNAVGLVRGLFRVRRAAPAAEVRAFVVGGAAPAEDAGDPDADPLALDFRQRGRPLYLAELHVARAACGLDAEQLKALAREGRGAFDGVVRRYVEVQKKMQRGEFVGGPEFDARSAFADGIEATLREHLSPKHADAYRAEVKRRDAEQRAAVVRNLVAQLDEHLVLSPSQRENLSASLETHWDKAWGWSPEMLTMYGTNYFPQIPDTLVVPLLNDRQRPIWDGLQKVQFGFMGIVSNEPLEADLWPEEDAADRAAGPVKLPGPPEPGGVEILNGVIFHERP